MTEAVVFEIVAQTVIFGSILGFVAGCARAILMHAPGAERMYERERMRW